MRARADLLRSRGLTPPLPTTQTPRARAPRRERLSLARRAVAHLALFGLVLLVLAGELGGAWSALAAADPQPVAQVGEAAPIGVQPVSLYQIPLSLAPVELARAGPAPLAPALQRPSEAVSSFRAYHALEEGETLGAIAERYGVSLEALVWTNRLGEGDALMLGQVLRIPRVAGVAHTVRKGETVADLAAHFGVGPEAILTFAPNGLGADGLLQPGAELFIPGGSVPTSSDWLSRIGGPAALAGRGPEPAGIVRETQTNLRTGPSTEHPRVAQLAAGRQVALRARHDDWLQVELGSERGWIRQDMLTVAADVVGALPETTDFPAPPPRWVWPARGAISSPFGPRWGAFHNGLDIANRAWTPIVAARAGVVEEAGWCSGYGYCVKLRHEGGVETIYGHLIARPVVARGDEVAAGELIGNMGSTYDRAGGGYSTGVHLHFTLLLNGRAVDPLRFLP